MASTIAREVKCFMCGMSLNDVQSHEAPCPDFRPYSPRRHRPLQPGGYVQARGFRCGGNRARVHNAIALCVWCLSPAWEWWPFCSTLSKPLPQKVQFFVCMASLQVLNLAAAGNFSGPLTDLQVCAAVDWSDNRRF
eukprot:3123349-Amphidinium_carterae.1